MKLKKLLLDNKQSVIIFCIFCFTLLLKNALFKVFVDNIIPFSWIFTQPVRAFLFYMPLLLPAIVMSSFVFLFKRYHWTWLFNLLFDLWIISNLLYSRAYNSLLAIDGIMMVDNMNGTWGSIISYWKPVFLVFPLITILYSTIVYFLRNKKCHSSNSWLLFVLLIALSFVFSSHRLVNEKYSSHGVDISPIKDLKLSLAHTLNPLYCCVDYINCVENHPDFPSICFVSSKYSILTYSIMSFSENIHLNNKIKECVQVDENAISPFINNTGNKPDYPKNKLLIILVESFESWVVDNQPIFGNVACPHLQEFIHKNQHIIYFPHVVSQTRFGNSGDGQMLVMTGLLPLQQGVACMMFGDNTYPSLAKLFRTSAIVNPCKHIWNQDTMNVRYGFNRIVEPELKDWNDEQMLSKLDNLIGSNDFILSITISTHAPFEKGAHGPFEKEANMPEQLRKYLNAFHYTDACLGALVNKIESDSLFRDYTIVITGDHTVFKGAMRNDLVSQIKQNNERIPQSDAFVPLIIYSPELNKRVINDTVYQMDIYPTIINLIGCEDYYWKGFGVNLLDDKQRKNRRITENDAFVLSNSLILGNYFKDKI